mgnify:CR=1 FL=1
MPWPGCTGPVQLPSLCPQGSVPRGFTRNVRPEPPASRRVPVHSSILPVGGVDEDDGAAPPPRVPGMSGLLGSLRGQGWEWPCAVSCVRHALSGVWEVEVPPFRGMVSTGILGGVLPCAWAAVPIHSPRARSDAIRRGRAIIVLILIRSRRGMRRFFVTPVIISGFILYSFPPRTKTTRSVHPPAPPYPSQPMQGGDVHPAVRQPTGGTT